MAINPNLVVNEPEVVIYAKITEPNGLSDALRYEDHLQLEGEMTTGARIRCRRTTKRAVKEFTQTVKVPVKTDADMQSNHEKEITINEDFFKVFAYCAKKAVKKTRYTFESTNVTFTMKNNEQNETITLPKVFYEVDVFENKNGQHLHWCKIDVEIGPILNALKAKGIDFANAKSLLRIKTSHLPFKPINPIMSTSDLPEHKAFFDKFWGEVNLNPLEVLND